MLLLAQRSFHAFFLSVACEKMNKHHISSLRGKKRKRNLFLYCTMAQLLKKKKYAWKKFQFIPCKRFT